MTGAHPGPGEFRLRSVAVTAYGPTVLEAIGYSATVPVTPLLARQLGASVGQAAVIAGLTGVGQLIASLPAGVLIARIGERRALASAAILGAALALLAGSAGHLLILAAASLMTGMTWSVFLLGRQGFMIDAVPAAMRARALSSLGGSHRIGMVIGPLIAAPVIARWGIRPAFVVAAVAGLAALVLILRTPDLSVAARDQARDDPASVFTVLGEHRRTLLTVGMAATVINGLRAVRMAVLPLWGDHVGLSPAAISLLFAIGGVIEVALFYPAGVVMDRAGRRFIAAPVAAVLGGSLLLLPLAHDFAAVAAVTVVMALGNGLGSGIVMTLGADTAPSLHRAKYLGGWRLCGDVGASAGPWVLAGVSALAGLGAASAVIGAAALAGSPAIWRSVRGVDRRRLRGG